MSKKVNEFDEAVERLANLIAEAVIDFAKDNPQYGRGQSDQAQQKFREAGRLCHLHVARKLLASQWA